MLAERRSALVAEIVEVRAAASRPAPSQEDQQTILASQQVLFMEVLRDQVAEARSGL